MVLGKQKPKATTTTKKHRQFARRWNLRRVVTTYLVQSQPSWATVAPSTHPKYHPFSARLWQGRGLRVSEHWVSDCSDLELRALSAVFNTDLFSILVRSHFHICGGKGRRMLHLLHLLL